ncbi:MAG: response regulator transcription factor [Bryobacteraceae bacterium]
MTRVTVSAASELVRVGLETVIASSGVLALAEAPEADVALVEADSDYALDFAQPVVWITDRPPGSWIASALRAGVKAILPRAATAAEIVAAVQAAAAGLIAAPADTVDSWLPPAPPSVSASEPQAPLTPREVDVLRMLAEGAGNKEIAFRLGISEHTVKFHIASIFNKLDVSTRTEAVTAGIRQGLILL